MAPPSEFTGHSLARRASFSNRALSPEPVVDAPAQASYAPNYSEQPTAPDAADAAAATDAAADAAAAELLADELPARRFSTEDFFADEAPPPAAAAPPPAEPPAAEAPPAAEEPPAAKFVPSMPAEERRPSIDSSLDANASATETAEAVAEAQAEVAEAVAQVAEAVAEVEAAAPDDPASPARRESTEPLSTSAVEMSLEPPSPAISDGILSSSNEGASP